MPPLKNVIFSARVRPNTHTHTNAAHARSDGSARSSARTRRIRNFPLRPVRSPTTTPSVFFFSFPLPFSLSFFSPNVMLDASVRGCCVVVIEARSAGRRQAGWMAANEKNCKRPIRKSSALALSTGMVVGRKFKIILGQAEKFAIHHPSASRVVECFPHR